LIFEGVKPHLVSDAHAEQEHGLYRNLYNKGPLKNGKTGANAEHTHHFLTHMLSMGTSVLHVFLACASVPDAYAQHTHKGRSIRLKVHKREIFYGSDFEIFTFS
jgi:hypothetical protein